MRGEISTEYTAWCGAEDCQQWEQVAADNKAQAAGFFRDLYWKKTKKDGWVCPRCLRKRKCPRERKKSRV